MSHKHRREIRISVRKKARVRAIAARDARICARWKPWNQIEPLWGDPWHPHPTYPYPYHGVAS